MASDVAGEPEYQGMEEMHRQKLVLVIRRDEWKDHLERLGSSIMAHVGIFFFFTFTKAQCIVHNVHMLDHFSGQNCSGNNDLILY